MKMFLQNLYISFKEANELIPFKRISYFYGKIGAGKSSIARLIDFCLGGEIDLTPALQSEFVSATLHLIINDTEIRLYRERGSNQINATWVKKEDAYQVIIPARKPNGEVIPNTGVEVLSDLLFFIAGIKAPKVRRSKKQEDSELSRLTMRDLLWYCYLEQDTMDNNFFNLDSENHFKQYKSRDVLRLLVGFHQEGVSELETKIEEVRTSRLKYEQGAKALEEALQEVNFIDLENIDEESEKLSTELIVINSKINTFRSSLSKTSNHAGDDLRKKGKEIASKIDLTEQAIDSSKKLQEANKKHINELLMLTVKMDRNNIAKALLNKVEFVTCPRCTQKLPERENIQCLLCGQENVKTEGKEVYTSTSQLEISSKDTQARINELKEMNQKQESQIKIQIRELNQLEEEKERIDKELNEVMTHYDSAFLSSILDLEHTKIELEQKIIELKRFKSLFNKIKELQKKAIELAVEEKSLKKDLELEREKAEKDKSNIERLQDLFLDCLERVKFPGLSIRDVVQIRSPYFLPEIYSPDTEGLINTSFSNMGSGGKKTLFKCCFVLAIHRLALEINALMPNFIIIDSPMKNISASENKLQFEALHELIYELANNEMKETQFILISNNFFSPPDFLMEEVYIRHMLDTEENPPLIRYYNGH
jgi:hypothetical protein